MFAVQAVKPLTNPIPDAVSLASASTGPFATNGDKWTKTAGAGGPDLAINTSGILVFEQQGALTVSETPWSYCDGTSGWYWEIDTTAVLRLKVRNGAVTTIVEAVPNTIVGGVHWLVWARLNSGVIHYSLDGFRLQTVASPTYTAGTASAVEEMGGVNTALIAAGNPCKQIRVLGVAYVNAVLTDQEIVSFAAQQSATNRYTMPATITGHANLISAWQATDWDGASGTTTASHGSTPVTYTKNGTIVKNTLGAENIHRVLQSMCSNGGERVAQTIQAVLGDGSSYLLRNPMDRIVVDCANPTRLGALMVNDTYESRVYETMIGVETDGVPFGGGSAVSWVGRQVKDVTNLPAVIASLAFISGIAAELLVGVDITQRGTIIEALRVPAATPITKIHKPVSPTRRLVCHGDGVTAGLGTEAQPVFQSYAVCMRKEYFSDGDVTVYGWAGRNWFEQIATAPMVAALVARLTPMLLDGTNGAPILVSMLDRDDYGYALWTPAAMQAQETAFYIALHAAIPGIQIYAVSTPVILDFAGGTTPNALGFTLQDYRNATQASTVGLAYVTFVDGTALMTSAGVCSDQERPSADGYETINENLKITIGYDQYYWKAFSTVPYSWVGDAAYVNNTGAVATWTNYTGGTDFVQATGANKPTQSNAYGTLNKGSINFDGTAQFMTANALGSLPSGSNIPFSFAVSLSATSITPGHNGQYLSYSHSTTAAFGFHNMVLTTASKMAVVRIGDAGVSISLTSAGNYSTLPQCLVGLYDGTLMTIRRQGVATSISGTSQNKSPMTTNQLSVGVFYGGATPGTTFFGGKERSVLLSPVGVMWDSNTYQYIETKLINEGRPI